MVQAADSALSILPDRATTRRPPFFCRWRSRPCPHPPPAVLGGYFTPLGFQGAFLTIAMTAGKHEQSMRTCRCARALWAAVILAGQLWTEAVGLSQRVANSTLQMPQSPPVHGFQTTNTF